MCEDEERESLSRGLMPGPHRVSVALALVGASVVILGVTGVGQGAGAKFA